LKSRESEIFAALDEGVAGSALLAADLLVLGEAVEDSLDIVSALAGVEGGVGALDYESLRCLIVSIGEVVPPLRSSLMVRPAIAISHLCWPTERQTASKSMFWITSSLPSFFATYDLTNERYAFGVDKNQPELLTQVNDIIKEMKSDGTFSAICDGCLCCIAVVLVAAAGCERSADAGKRKHESDYLRKLFHDVFLLFDLMTVL